MAIPRFPQKRESDLVVWSGIFSAAISASPGTYGLTAAQAADFAALHAAFASAYSAANNANTNSKAAIIAKNVAKEALLNSSGGGGGGAHALVNIVQAFPGMDNATRCELGLRQLGARPVRVQKPGAAPDLQIIATIGRTVKVRIRGKDNPDQRGKPAGCDGATVLFYHVPPNASADELRSPPTNPSDWSFGLNTARTVFDVSIPESVPAGSKVWLTAFWFNKRKQPGPAASAKSVRVDDALAKLAA